jgi:hypothetical protein
VKRIVICLICQFFWQNVSLVVGEAQRPELGELDWKMNERDTELPDAVPEVHTSTSRHSPVNGVWRLFTWRVLSPVQRKT